VRSVYLKRKESKDRKRREFGSGTPTSFFFFHCLGVGKKVLSPLLIFSFFLKMCYNINVKVILIVYAFYNVYLYFCFEKI
jgi:hypothetical protein